jgi:serine/threonine-protein kinase ULK/ATG1
LNCELSLFLFLNRNAVGDLNNKYKHCLIMCKQLSAQEELLTHDEMKGVTLTADKLLYLHAIDLCLNAASLEFFGKAQEVRKSLFGLL